MDGVFEVGREDLSRTRVVGPGSLEPGQGEVLFEVERFAFSANNITYALLGEQARYWDLFPAEPGWGRIPVWGYLRVITSRVPGVEPGRRALGLVPMGTHVRLRAGRVRPGTFTEESSHRAGLSSVYNVYAWADGPGDDALLVLRPVFWLSFMLDDYLTGRPLDRVIVTSASSKAAIGLGWLLRRRGIPVTALTSAGHAEFAGRLYDEVLTYDDVSDLGGSEAVLIDIAGNAAVRDRVRARLGPRLAETVVAGSTHQADGAQAGMFSAPQRITERAADLGWAELDRRFSTALGEFAESSAAWLKIEHARGLDGAGRVYEQVLAGVVPPDRAHLVELAGT
jgi:NADPH:quinone reductase-like Zn-dependent oxidoreductase